MTSDNGDMETIEVLLLERVTVSPEAGAGFAKTIGKETVWPGERVIFPGNVIRGELSTVTAAVMSPYSGGALAWTIVEPAATLVTGTTAVPAPAVNWTDVGTVETAGVVELRSAVRPPEGAKAGRLSVRFWVEAMPEIVREGGLNVIVGSAAPTCTAAAAPAISNAEALTTAFPLATPVICNGRTLAVAPCAITTAGTETVKTEGLLLETETYTPPAGAGLANVTGKSTVWPGWMLTPVGRTISDADVTVTVAEAAVHPGALAVTCAEPTPTPVMGTFALAAPGGNAILAGTAATVGVSERRFTISPAWGAGVDKFS
jgi:hypothetical protein